MGIPIKTGDYNTLDVIINNVKKSSKKSRWKCVKRWLKKLNSYTPGAEYELEGKKEAKFISRREKERRFKNCVDKWHELSQEETEIWREKASGMFCSGFNLFIKDCIEGYCNEEKEMSDKFERTINVPDIIGHGLGVQKLRIGYGGEVSMKRDLVKFPEGIYIGRQMQEAYENGLKEGRKNDKSNIKLLEMIIKEMNCSITGKQNTLRLFPGHKDEPYMNAQIVILKVFIEKLEEIKERLEE